MSLKQLLLVFLVLISGCVLAGEDGGQALAQSESMKKVFQRVNPAVVEIAAVRSQKVQGDATTRNILGSGVIISEDGRIMTSAHLVNTADSIRVRFLDGETFSADVVS